MKTENSVSLCLLCHLMQCKLGVVYFVYRHAYLKMATDTASTIDLQKLQNEFARAVHAEGKYERENAAKFRAVNQKVASYEEFK